MNNVKTIVKNTQKLEQQVEQKNYLAGMERQLAESTINDLPEICNKRRQDLIDKLKEFKNRGDENVTNPDRIKGSSHIVIADSFFKPFDSYVIGSNVKYTYEKFIMAFELYEDMINQINENLCLFYPTLSHFCHYLGISVNTWKNVYCNSPDTRIAEYCAYILDWIFDYNMRLSEIRKIDNVSSIFRSKVELNKIEQAPPQTVIISDSISIDEIKDRLNKFSYLGSSDDKKVIDYNDGNQ